jgi:acetyl esterase/lipase
MMPEIPIHLRMMMAERGPIWGTDVSGNVDLMLKEFSELHKTSQVGGFRVHKEISYGEHDRQKIDVFTPERLDGVFPVVLFVHGGAFVSGHRNRTEQIYSNVLIYLARHGIAGINIGYRLATDAQFPAASEDIASVVAWADRHASKYNWDKNCIFLMSHSAGAAHAGSYAYDPRFKPSGHEQIAGMIVISGRVRIDNLPENPNALKVEAYYGSDNSNYDLYSPVSHINYNSVPTFVAWAEFENPLIDVYCAELVYRLAQAKRKAPPSMWLAGHNHTSAIAHIGTSEDKLGQAIVDFVCARR